MTHGGGGLGNGGNCEVHEGARLALLRCGAFMRDYADAKKLANDPYWPTHFPLYAAGEEWGFEDDVMWLAAEEAVKLGQCEGNPTPPDYPLRDFILRITDAGYDFIKAHDMIGEVRQDARNA